MKIYKEFYFGIGLGYTQVYFQHLIILPFIVILIDLENDEVLGNK